MLNKNEKKELINKQAVLELGWTERLINKYLPEPILKTNPRYKTAAPMKLWEKELVEQISQTYEFMEDMKLVERRREGARRGVDTKVDKLLELIDEKIERINVQRISLAKLKRLTIEDKQDWYNYNCRYYQSAYSCDDIETIERWEVNYIRHNLTTYDADLFDMSGKVGVNIAYCRYKNAVLNKIKEQYPELALECNRQKV